MNEKLELQLQAWIDGEAAPADARRLARLAQSDPEIGQLAQELRMVRGILASNPPEMAVPETRDFYWSKIERQIQNLPVPAEPAVSRGVLGWRRWVSSLAGMTAVGLMAMFIFGQFHPATNFDEVSATADGMEAMTFHDQSAGVTVVWLQDSQDAAQPTDAATAIDDGNSDLEM
jgi:anti-sigma factor RsiW